MLVSSSAEVRQAIGTEAWDQLTYPKIFLDSVEAVSPVILGTETGRTLLVNVSDSAAVQNLGGFKTETWGRYFDWDQEAGHPAPTFAEVVTRAAGHRTISVGPDLVAARYEALVSAGPVELRDEPVHAGGACFVYEKRRAEVEAQWAATRDRDAEAVSSFVATLRFGQELLEAMSRPPVGFAPLDSGLAAAGLTGFLVTSPFNAELLTGLPAILCEQLGLACLFRPDRDTLLVMTRRPLERCDFAALPSAPSAKDVLVGAKLRGPIGFEEGHLTIGQHRLLTEAGIELRGAIGTLRRWEDQRAGTDLPYFVVAANGVLRGVAAAEGFLDRHVDSEPTERDVVAAFDQGVAAFARSVGFEGRVGSYFDIVHPGERTLLPAVAGDFPLRAGDATIKFDMGLLVRDAFGCVRGCSDIARTLSPDPLVGASHDALRTALVDRLIPSMRPGMSGGAIHAAGVEALRGCTDALAAAGLMRPDRTLDGYVRDCGHTIHRTTAGSVYFLPGVKQTVEPGMLGCVEYVWPIGDRIVAVEEGYYVTDTHVVPFTI